MRLADLLPGGAEVLEIAAGAGDLAVPLAQTTRMRVTALDSSAVAIDAARTRAERAGLRMNVQRADPARLPFPDCSFDFVICRAPMKKFPDPVAVLREMRRVLKPERRGMIVNMRRDVPRDQGRKFVENRSKSVIGQMLAMLDFRMRLRGTYTMREFEDLLGRVPFGSSRIDGTPLGVEVWFER